MGLQEGLMGARRGTGPSDKSLRQPVPDTPPGWRTRSHHCPDSPPGVVRPPGSSPNFPGCPPRGKGGGCGELCADGRRPATPSATHPFPSGLLVQGGHPGGLPLAPPAVQRQDPGEQRVRPRARVLARRRRPPRAPRSRPGQRPLRQVQAHRAQGHDEERHQDHPLDLTEPRVRAGHGDGAYPARLAPASPGSPGGTRTPRRRVQDISPRPAGGRGERGGWDPGGWRSGPGARGPGRGAGSGEPGGRAGRAGGNAGPRAAATARGCAPDPAHLAAGDAAAGAPDSASGQVPRPRPGALPPACAAPRVPPAARQWPERLRPGAGKRGGPGRGLARGGGGGVAGARDVPASLKAPRPGSPRAAPPPRLGAPARPRACDTGAFPRPPAAAPCPAGRPARPSPALARARRGDATARGAGLSREAAGFRGERGRAGLPRARAWACGEEVRGSPSACSSARQCLALTYLESP